MRLLSQLEAAGIIGCRPRDFSDAIYGRHLEESLFVRVGGRRAVPEESIEPLRQAMVRLGKVRPELIVQGVA